MPDDRRALLYGPVESLGDAIRLDDLETATRYRDQLNVFFVAPYASPASLSVMRLPNSTR